MFCKNIEENFYFVMYPKLYRLQQNCLNKVNLRKHLNLRIHAIM